MSHGSAFPTAASSLETRAGWTRRVLPYVIPPFPLRSFPLLERVASSIRPAGVFAYPRTNEDVSALVKWASKEDVEFVVCGGGHSAGASSSTDGGLVIDLGRCITSVTVDAPNKTVTVGGGARWRQVDDVICPLGLATAAGTVSDTGVGGLSLGGGLGHLMGTTGLVVDNILGATVVLASGEIVEANADSHPDLYWAIRGGGGAFGVVTSFTFRLHDQRSTIGFSMSLFAPDQLEIIVPKIQKWLGVRTPDEAGILAFVSFKGTTPSIMFGVTYNGPTEEGQLKIADIVETAFFGKEMREVKAADLNTQLTNFLAPGKTIYQTASSVPVFTPELVTKLYKEWETVKVTSPRPEIPSVMVAFVLSNWEAASKIDPHATPDFNRSKNQILLDTEITYTDFTAAKELASHLRRVAGSQSSYLNWETEDASSSSTPGDARARATFGDENLARLREIKGRYDPERRFRSWFG